MKKLIYLIALVGLFITYSCGSSSTEKGKEETKEVKSESLKDCDDFLANYKDWIDDYLKVIEEYVKNPTDEKLAERFMESGLWPFRDHLNRIHVYLHAGDDEKQFKDHIEAAFQRYHSG